MDTREFSVFEREDVSSLEGEECEVVVLGRPDFDRVVVNDGDVRAAVLVALQDRFVVVEVLLAGSGEGERGFRREAERRSGLKPNTIVA